MWYYIKKIAIDHIESDEAQSVFGSFYSYGICTKFREQKYAQSIEGFYEDMN